MTHLPITVLLFSLLAHLTGAAFANQDDSWAMIRKAMFGDRKVNNDAKGVVELFAPQRAEDAAVVPITIRTRMPQSRERYIKSLWLVIDQNLSPFGVRFNLTPDTGRADIETRIRLESASPVRVVAELNDGSLWMDHKMVFGAGGCSSVGAKNEAALRNLGRMRLTVEEQFSSKGEPLLAQLRISHPQTTGMGLDNLDPPRYVRQMRVFYGDTQILSADLDFTISENPSFRFYFLPYEKGLLRAQIEDTENLVTEQTLEVDPDKVRLY